MKKTIALLCLALSTGAAFAAPAVPENGAYCAQLSSDIAARSALFLTVARATPGSAELTASAPQASRRRVLDTDVALQDIANEIWSLRTRMAYLDCVQARTFAY